ncbi:host nuclease inhibitor GamL [Kosakonia sp. SMBL-WEM22]|nr:host nuclease inhibitor GamL [Kosakonia sp. SMBL-WEM22]
MIALFPETPAQLVTFSIPPANTPYAGLSHNNATEAYNDFVTAVDYAQADYEWEHRTGYWLMTSMAKACSLPGALNG